MDNLEKRIRLLYKKIEKTEDITERNCEGFLNVMHGIKEELISKGKISWGDLEDIQLGGFFGVTEEDMSRAIDEMVAQLEEIALGLHIDFDEEIKIQQLPPSNSPVIIQNIQSQHQEQYQTQDVKIESLKKELEEELTKEIPDESKVKKIIDNIINTARSGSSSIISSVILKVLGI